MEDILFFIFLIVLIVLFFVAYIVSVFADTKRTDHFCRMMAAYADCRVLIIEAKSKYPQKEKKKSNRPKPSKLQRLLSSFTKVLTSLFEVKKAFKKLFSSEEGNG